jgi:transposase
MDQDGSVTQRTQRFGTMTGDLLQLRDWLSGFKVTHVAMESTGVLWKPVFNILEDAFTVWVCNAQHIKQVPGRKTDVTDCQWIAQLMQYGLLHPSFVPQRALRELRDLTRERAQMMNEVTRVKNRIHKVLEDANIKASCVMSDVLGVSGRAILTAIVEGTEDPAALAELARGRLRSKTQELRAALQGRVSEHHRFMLREHLRHLKALEILVGELEARIESACQHEALNPPQLRESAPPSGEDEPSCTARYVPPFRDCLELLDSIPGVNTCIAQTILAEIGTDMAQFPTPGQLASWAGICPGNSESAGKRHSGKTRHGNRWLRRVLTQAAWAATHEKPGSYLKSVYRRIARRRGKKRALVAVAHAILIIAHCLLSTGAYYHDLGQDYFDHLNEERLTRYLVKRLESLGHAVELQPVA